MFHFEFISHISKFQSSKRAPENRIRFVAVCLVFSGFGQNIRIFQKVSATIPNSDVIVFAYGVLWFYSTFNYLTIIFRSSRISQIGYSLSNLGKILSGNLKAGCWTFLIWTWISTCQIGFKNSWSFSLSFHFKYFNLGYPAKSSIFVHEFDALISFLKFLSKHFEMGLNYFLLDLIKQFSQASKYLRLIDFYDSILNFRRLNPL
jgi:hypothetical protein